MRNENNPFYKYTEKDIKKGLKVNIDKHGAIKVMAVESGYVMARRPKGHPFCQAVDVFLERINYIPAA